MRFRLLLSMGLACFVASAWSLDLSQAYRAALERDASIQASRASADARRERLPQARAQLLPNVSLNLSRNKNVLDSVTPALGQEIRTQERYSSANDTLTVRQPLFRKYQLAEYRQAQAVVAEANATLEKDMQSLVVRVAGAYFEALLAEDRLQYTQAQKKAYTVQLEAARKRLSGGSGTRTDIDEAQARLDMNVAQELEALQAIDLARRQLQVLTDQPITRLAPLDDRKLVLVRPTPDEIEQWALRAEKNSPEIQSLLAQRDVAKFEVEKMTAGHYPTLDAIAQWSRSNSDNITRINSRYESRSIGVQLTVPIYSGGYVSSTIRQAVAELERAEQALEAARRDLGVRVHREFRGVTEGVPKVRALEQAVRSTEQLVTSNRRSFEAGSRTLVDVLNAEQQRASALNELSQARFVYLISRIRLHSLAGGDKAEVLDEVNGMLVP